jgi:iron(III) transport system ATP-binding protein
MDLFALNNLLPYLWSMLEVHGLCKQVSEIFSLGEVSFVQHPGERLAIAGSSGSGKSTLLQLLAGHQSPERGSIHLHGKRVLGPHEQLLPGHPGLAYLPQNCDLPHHYYVHELFSYANQWEAQLGKDLFAWCRIDHLLDRRHQEISGGEKQRIALALLLISSPNWLLLDEPFSHLDAINKAILQQVLQEVAQRLSITCLLCSHHPEDIFSWAERLLVIRDGKIIADDTPMSLYTSPPDTYVAGLLGEYQLVSVEHAQFWQLKKDPSDNLVNRLVRPEKFFFSPEFHTRSLPCQIIFSHFAGKGWCYEVDCEGSTYRFFSLNQHWLPGTMGYLHLSDAYPRE